VISLTTTFHITFIIQFVYKGSAGQQEFIPRTEVDLHRKSRGAGLDLLYRFCINTDFRAGITVTAI